MKKPSTPDIIDVAVGLIRNPAGAWLCCQRTDADEHGGLWEFPGGKFEAGENLEQALLRELYEELDLAIVTDTKGLSSPESKRGGSVVTYVDFTWQHPGKEVHLHCGLVQLQGSHNMRLRVHQSHCWLATKDLAGLDWLASNRPIIDRIQTDFR